MVPRSTFSSEYTNVSALVPGPKSQLTTSDLKHHHYKVWLGMSLLPPEVFRGWFLTFDFQIAWKLREKEYILEIYFNINLLQQFLGQCDLLSNVLQGILGYRKLQKHKGLQ